ncbi:MAG: hypothetical protein NC102_03485 [Clostridium sp.]|nr:hypothetical protein [Clostridium sp.]
MNEKDDLNAVDINVDSLWLIGPRSQSGKHANVYHGNFVPQIPNQMLRRYTREGDIVLEAFMGSGTTLFECETLGRNYIGFDINKDIIKYVDSKMIGVDNINFRIHNCDICDTETVSLNIAADLAEFGAEMVDHIIVHPPYFNIIKFTSKEEDLSRIDNIPKFIEKFILAIRNCWRWLRAGKYMSLIVGDIYKDGEVVPLAFYLMQAIKNNFNVKMKGIVIKDMVGNRAKIGNEDLWRYRTLKGDTFLFKHEYIFVFKKIS